MCRCNTLNLCDLAQTDWVEQVVLKYTTLFVVMAGLLGYCGFGTFSKTLWRAVTYSFLWGVALFFLLGALAGAPPFGFEVTATCITVHLTDTKFLNPRDYTSGVWDTLAVCFAVNQIFAVVSSGAGYISWLGYNRV